MPRIIIVEDDPMISEIYQKKFSESGFDVLAADSGDKVLELAKTNSVDVILLDLIMPKMDGFEVLKNLRENYDPNIKVIIFSNLSQREDREKALKLGANGFVTKADYSPSDLVKEINRLMNQFSEQQRNEEIRNGGELPGNDLESGGKARILLVEDEDIFIEMFGDKLKQEGFEVVSAKNGAWGYKEALKQNFDFFIVDMSMPAMTGDEIVERLKLDEKTKNIPVIMLSASSTDEERRKVESLGVDEFLLKTQVTPSELCKKVEEILKNRQV